MRRVTVTDIIRTCRQIDETACDIYAKLAGLAEAGELSAFWREMSEEEAQHVSFWKRVEAVEAFSGLPELFDDPTQVLAELDHALSRSKDILARCEHGYTTAGAFTLAYRMEFYLLHPAFALMFHLLGPTAGGVNPESDYESHIAKFIAMLARHGNVSPELELLGETIKRLWEENKHLTIQSTHDHLTGILNRRGFFTVSAQLAHLSQRAGSRIGVMMLDLDHFKSVNDRLGHSVGDQVLKGVSGLLTQRLRASDLVGRYGGEEFIVMLTNIAADSTGRLAEALRKTIEDNPPEQIPVTVSIGFTEAKLGHAVQEEYHQLIRNADTALYQAKAAGRNRVAEYTP